jgi:cytochrome b involved in lipid metabolism
MRLSQKFTTSMPAKLTAAQVAKHATQSDCWVILHGRVYDVTRYLPFHPGGVDKLMKAAGKDATVLFNHYHSFVNASAILERCLVGQLVAG